MAVFRCSTASGYSARTVDVAFVGPDGIGPDGHAFDDGMGVALEDAPVHEGAGVAFIGVADDVLDVTRGIPARIPI